MKLKHPNGPTVVETDNPEPYLSQGWVEVKSAPAKKAAKKDAPPKGE